MKIMIFHQLPSMQTSLVQSSNISFQNEATYLLEGLELVNMRIEWLLSRMPPRAIKKIELEINILGQNLADWVSSAKSAADKKDWTTNIDSMYSSWKKQIATGSGTVTQIRFDTLVKEFSLSQIEIQIFLIALSPDVDQSYGYIYSTLLGRNRCERPTASLVLDLLTTNPAEKLELRRNLTKKAKLFRMGLLQSVPEEVVHDDILLVQCIAVNPNVIAFLFEGNNKVDKILYSSTSLFLPHGGISESRIIKRHLLPDLVHANQPELGQYPLFVFWGEVCSSDKQKTATCLSTTLKAPMVVVDLTKMNPDEASFADELRLIARDLRLMKATLYLDDPKEKLLNDALISNLAFLDLISYSRTIFIGFPSRPDYTFMAHLRALPTS